jgi:glycosyltransferase involved in cell wall biosynthesis
MLAYLFPPLAGAGVQRSVKFAKYLPEHGIDPTVITTRSRWYPAKDPTLMTDLPPGMRVIRAFEVPLHRLHQAAAIVLGRLRLGALAAVIPWPDQHAGWIPGAVSAGLREIRRSRPDVLYSTAAPMSAHLAALILHRLTGIPWVADFRDEWTHNAELERLGPLARARASLESAVMRRAAAVTVVADYFTLAGEDRSKRVLIPNGVDPDDLAGIAGTPDEQRFRIAFVGTLYGGRDCGPLQAALRRLVERGVIDPALAEFRVVGNVWVPGGVALSGMSVVETGYLEHGRALREMAEASVLTVCLPPGSQSTTGKIWEYLSSGRPVLAVAPRESDAYRLVEELGAGYAVDPSDAAGLDAALEELYSDWRSGRLGEREGVRERVLSRYSRRKLAGDLAAVFRSVASGGG